MELEIHNYKIYFPNTFIHQFGYLLSLSTTLLSVDKITKLPDNLLCVNSLEYLIDYLKMKMEDEFSDKTKLTNILNYVDDILIIADFLCWMYVDEFKLHTIKLAKLCDYSEIEMYYSKFKLQTDLTIKSFNSVTDFYSETHISPFVTVRTNEFKDQINTLLGFDLTWTSEMVIAGGIVVGLIDPTKFNKDSDIDIWLLNPSDPDKVIKTILQNIKGKYVTILEKSILRVFIEDNEISINHIQIINTKYDTVEEIISNFDLDICKMAICHDKLCLYYNGLEQIKNNTIQVNYFFKHKLRRIQKYTNRGFNATLLSAKYNTTFLDQPEIQYKNNRSMHTFVNWYANFAKLKTRDKNNPQIINYNTIPDCKSIGKMDIESGIAQYDFENEYDQEKNKSHKTMRQYSNCMFKRNEKEMHVHTGNEVQVLPFYSVNDPCGLPYMMPLENVRLFVVNDIDFCWHYFSNVVIRASVSENFVEFYKMI